MSETANLIELFVVPSRGLLSALVRGAADANPLTAINWTQSDNATLRVRFFTENTADNTLVPLDYGEVDLGFSGRLADDLESDEIFKADSFTRTESSGDIYYDSPISLATVTGEAALTDKTSIDCTCDLQTTGPATKARFPVTLYRDIYRESGPLEDIVADMDALKAEAEADAAAADAARIAAEGHRDGAETAKIAAEGFRDDAETAKTEAETDAAAIADLIDTLDVPLPGAFPTDDQVMTGASPQAGVSGGVNGQGYTGASGPGLGFPASLPIPGDFTLTFRVRPHWTDASKALLADVGGIGLGLGYTSASLANPARLLFDNSGPAFGWVTGYTCAEMVGRWFSISVSRSGSTMSATLDGVALATTGTLGTPGLTTINRFLGGIVGGYGQFQGDVADIKLINRALTDDEIKACNKGEIPAELARRGFNAYGAGVMYAAPNDITGANSAATTTGVTFTQTGGTGSNTIYFHSPIAAGTTIKAGQRVRWSVNLSSTDYITTIVDGAIFHNGAFLDLVPAAQVGSVYTAEWVATQDIVAAGEKLLSIRISGVATTTAATRVVTFCTPSVDGTVANFAADQVSPEADWPCLVSGTVLKAGSGITALAPNPGIVRTARCTAADVSVTAGAEANSAFAAVSGDSVSTNLLAALEAGYGCTWTPDTDMPDGLIHKRGVKITGAGAANLRVRNLTAGSLNTGAVTGTLTIHIR